MVRSQEYVKSSLVFLQLDRTALLAMGHILPYITCIVILFINQPLGNDYTDYKFQI